MLRLVEIRFIRYMGVAFISILIDVFISMMLFYIFHTDYGTASNSGLIISTIFNYILNTFFVFNVKNNSDSAIIYLFTFVLGILTTNISVSIMYTSLGISFLLTKMLTFGIVFIQNYVLRTNIYRYSSETGRIEEYRRAA